MRFEGTTGYVASDDLKVAVNAAITLQRPLLVKGEPGTGKTVLALEVAKALGIPLSGGHLKPPTKPLKALSETAPWSGCADTRPATDAAGTFPNTTAKGNWGK